MSVPAAEGLHEFIVAPELAEVAERLGVHLHAGDRVRFEAIAGEGSGMPHRRRLSWLGRKQRTLGRGWGVQVRTRLVGQQIGFHRPQIRGR